MNRSIVAVGLMCLMATSPPALASPSASSVEHFGDLQMNQRAAAVLDDFCSYGPRLNLKTVAAVPTPTDAGIRLIVTRIAEGVAVTIYPDDTIKTAQDATDLIPALFAATRQSCADPVETWPVLTTNVEGLDVDVQSGRVHFSFQGQD